ncbi:MAG: helix-turn-helix domain-containing protein, partial [Erysipelotrichaceae bacterium]|nr:helix-turn-helix domain-containing protein [Erysipelotrichaceae bacterium]
KKKLTQSQLADMLGVTDKAISKWETGKGYPDISLLEPLAKVFNISLSELLSGNTISNLNISANMLRSKFYICPICGNVIHSMGELSMSCHGVELLPAIGEVSDEDHKILIEKIEDEYFVQIDHEMSKSHYISFIAGMSFDRLEMIKLYPEGTCEGRFKIRGLKRIYCFCNKDGLFYIDVGKGILDASYDYVKERKELEEAAKKLFG